MNDLLPRALPGELPRVIWMMWHDGWDRAPAVVRRCLESWRTLHPDWRFEQIHRGVLDQHLDVLGLLGLAPDRLSPVILSDLMRLQLLALHGGVWVDATVFCVKPLEAWLNTRLHSGFFAFRNPGPDRLLSNWFLAAVPGHPLITAWRDAAFDYGRTTRFSGNRRLRPLFDWMSRRWIAHPSAGRYWLSWPVQRLLRYHPYFWSHYLFGRLVGSREDLAACWNRTPAYDAAGPHALQAGRGLTGAMDDRARRALEGKEHPLYKLSWKFDASRVEAGSPLAELAGLPHRVSD